MKNKLILLTESLTSAGFKISGMIVESTELVRIKFEDLNNVELVVNGSAAIIENDDCDKEKLEQLKQLVSQQEYSLQKEFTPEAQDIFDNLLNAS